jgi:hypothetical protein
MKKHTAVIGAVALSSLLWVSRSNAETVTETGPNRALLRSGLFAVGVPYVASVIVATQSDHPGDKNLYYPVVGPWLDLANRGECDGFGQTSCNTETGYKVLLVADGIIQSIGALEILGAFLMPETRTARVAEQPRLFVSPSTVGRAGYGVAAIGTF